MTRHDLVPLSPPDFARLVTARPEVSAHRTSEDLPSWFGSARVRSVTVVGWREPAPMPWSGRQLLCCLETERAASGSLVHLSATFEPPIRHTVGQHLATLVLQTWAARRLAELRSQAEESLAVRRAA